MLSYILDFLRLGEKEGWLVTRERKKERIRVHRKCPQKDNETFD